MDSTSTGTPRTHPDDPVVGKRFSAWSVRHGKMATYFCEGHDPRSGYWMVNTEDSSDRRDVSERAINTTFHLKRG